MSFSMLEIVESPQAEEDPKAVGYLKDHYNACKNTSKLAKCNFKW